MDVDFPASYPSNTTPAGKPIDVQTLQQTFAALLRNYGTENGGSQTATLLEILRPAPSDSTEGRDRNQQRLENQRWTERQDFTQTERKLLDKSELRSNELIADYQHRLDRRDSFQNDYRSKIERSELSPSPVPTDAPALAMSSASSDTARSSDTLPSGEHVPPPQSTVPQVAGINSPSPLASTTVPNNSPGSGQVNAGIPMSMNVPASPPMPIAPQANPSTPFTVFTPLGRLGQSQKESDDKDNDEEDVFEEDSKKKQPFAMFEAVRLETTRLIQRNHSRQTKEPVSQSHVPQITEKYSKETSEKPKEVEPQQFRSVKTMADFLEVPIQNISVQKKEESNQPNPAQYLHRIAAACEAASQYAPIRMKINLDHLGTLTLRFFYKADKLALRFDTPSKESAKFVRNHLDGLRTIFSNRNIKIADLEIYSETEIN